MRRVVYVQDLKKVSACLKVTQIPTDTHAKP
jgi:hypothetical protein